MEEIDSNKAIKATNTTTTTTTTTSNANLSEQAKYLEQLRAENNQLEQQRQSYYR